VQRRFNGPARAKREAKHSPKVPVSVPIQTTGGRGSEADVGVLAEEQLRCAAIRFDLELGSQSMGRRRSADFELAKVAHLVGDDIAPKVCAPMRAVLADVQNHGAVDA
jgi:hypothetical protein